MIQKTVFAVALILISMSVSAQYKTLEIGDVAPDKDYKMENVDGEWLSYNSVKGETGTLVIFSCNTCPFVVAWEDRYPQVAKIANDNNVGLMLVNSNHLKRDGDDSKKAMKAHAEAKSYKWPYLVDNESKLANAYGAMTTPHVFLFDKNDKLVFIGAIDDNYKDASKVSAFYLKDAMTALAQGSEIAQKVTRATGCSIKRP